MSAKRISNLGDLIKFGFDLLLRRLRVQASIVDQETEIAAKVTTAGELRVATPPPEPPPNTTPVSGGDTTLVPKNGGIVSKSFLIPAGQTLTIQNFRGGGMTPEGKCVLGIDTDGDGVIDELIATGYIGGENNFNFDLNNEIVGDGTKQVIIYAQNNDNTSDNEMAFYWTGYLV